MAAKRKIYVGTMDGLYEAEGNGGAYSTRPLGLQGEGALRSPVVFDCETPGRMYAATSRGGMFRSEDAGETWQEINRGIVYKECWSVAQQPSTGEIWVGTGPTAVFHSTDGGDTWGECEQLRTLPDTKEWTFPGPPYVSHLKGLAVSADLPDVVIGAIEEGWVVRSTDNGKTWHNIKQGVEFDAHSVCYMPNDPAVVIVTSGKGVYRSGHGGDAFEDASEGLDRRYMAQIAVHTARPKVLFTAAAAVPPPSWRRPQGADAGFFRSEDQARSWQRVTGGLPVLIKGAPRATASDPNDPNTFLVGLTDGTIWISEDGAESFREVVGGLPQISSLAVARQ
jgi:hypothetical protein